MVKCPFCSALLPPGLTHVCMPSGYGIPLKSPGRIAFTGDIQKLLNNACNDIKPLGDGQALYSATHPNQGFLLDDEPNPESIETIEMTTDKVTTAQVLETALALTGGDRAKQHGPKIQNHQNIADLWNAYKPEAAMTAHDVAIFMALVKVARTKSGTFNVDNYIDGAGYFGIAAECATGEDE